jgi:aminoglycoside 6'-N-acetyltransferase
MELRGEHVILRSLEPVDAGALRAIRDTDEVRRWWGPVEDDFPLGDEPETTRLTVLEGTAVIGLIQYGEELEAQYRHAWIDVFLAPSHHGRGLGSDAVSTLVRHLLDARGHHRITIDPAIDNAAAVACYRRVGFRTVGVLRAYERVAGTDAYRDGLLMELVRLPRAGTASSPRGSSDSPRG